MAVRAWAVMLCAALMVGGCSAAEGSSVPSEVSGPSIIVPPTVPPSVTASGPATGPALEPAKDCRQSTVRLPAESETDGVELTVSTDPSRTSLLLKNTGSLTVIVVPDADFTSRLVAAPYANPKDQASRAALIAVNNSGGAAAVRAVPAYVPPAQVITLPPLWAICALTDDAKMTASVRYLQDRPSSAEYFVTKALADVLLVNHSSDRTRPALIRCAKSTLSVLKTHPGMSDIELYVEILGPRAACQAGYKALLGGSQAATEQLGNSVLGRLAGAPRLLANSRIFSTQARS
ncbi:hypothetical protein GCM10009804_64950 [Kribbella hippodromi]|uniref:Lipoprotein n=1 Tax=Kribbella hippodromi TaxID=434347 RepID=A0ABP4Q6N7_9ACTN